jgi:predicted TIM-barrel fold metal-dependent hydrolase
VALEFPELRVVAGHVGYPWTAEMICLAQKYPNVYVDTSAYKCRRYPPEFVEYLRGPGRRKVLFGTNYPMLTAQECLTGLEALALDAEAQDLFLRGNACRVFAIETGSRPTHTGG